MSGSGIRWAYLCEQVNHRILEYSHSGVRVCVRESTEAALLVTVLPTLGTAHKHSYGGVQEEHQVWAGHGNTHILREVGI